MTLMDTEHTTWTKQYINGSWVDGSGEKTMENINPYTGEVIATWRSSNKKDIDKAYESAQKIRLNGRSLCPLRKKRCCVKFHP